MLWNFQNSSLQNISAVHLVNNQLSLLAYILWPNHSFMNSHEEVKKSKENLLNLLMLSFSKHFWQMFWPIKSNKNEFVKPFIHEGFASYFYGFVQGDSKWAPDNPQNYLLKYTTFDGHSFFKFSWTKQILYFLISRTTDAQRGDSLHCTAENSLPLPNF